MKFCISAGGPKGCSAVAGLQGVGGWFELLAGAASARMPRARHPAR